MNLPTIVSMESIRLREKFLINVHFHWLSQYCTVIMVLFLLMVKLAAVKRTLWSVEKDLILKALFPTLLSRSTGTSMIHPTTIRSF